MTSAVSPTVKLLKFVEPTTWVPGFISFVIIIGASFGPFLITKTSSSFTKISSARSIFLSLTTSLVFLLRFVGSVPAIEFEMFIFI